MSGDRALALALQLHRAGALDRAQALYRSILSRDPDQIEARHLLGVAALQQGRLDDAIRDLGQAAALAPDNPVYQCRLGAAYSAACDPDTAARCFGKALILKPDYPEALNNLATVLAATGRLDAAVDHYRRALALQEAFPEAWNNLGVALKDRGARSDAIQAFRRAIALRPDYPEAEKNLGMAELAGGDFARGFAAFDRRFDEPNAWRRRFPQPPWRGQSLAGQTILVWGEQGIGDEVMYGTLLADVIAQAGRCVIECAPRLVPLFARAFPSQTVLARSDPPDPETGRADIAYQTAAGSLCRWFRRCRRDFGSGRAYLTADPDKVARLRARYRKGLDRDRPVIGIAWQSRLHDGSLQLQQFARSKSCGLDHWGPIFAAAPHARFVSLQYGDCGEAIAGARAAYGADIVVDSEVDQFASLDDFAAQIGALDLVVSTSNTAAHLAGALGKPVWLLLAKVPDWRWQEKGAESLWYPKVKLFRQCVAGDWRDPVAAVAEALPGGLDGAGGLDKAAPADHAS